MRPDGDVIDLSPGDVKAGLADGSIVLVDVREPYELAGGMIPGSRSMPLSVFDPSALPTELGRIVFSCAAGVRSRAAIAASRNAGYDVREHLGGGFKAWVLAGEAVEVPEA